MASAKRTFAPRTFAARNFACGTFRGFATSAPPSQTGCIAARDLYQGGLTKGDLYTAGSKMTALYQGGKIIGQGGCCGD